MLPDQLQGPGGPSSRCAHPPRADAAPLCAGLGVRVLDPRGRQREGCRSGGHGLRATAASRGRRIRNGPGRCRQCVGGDLAKAERRGG